MIAGLLRCFGSSTLWSGLISLAVSMIAKHNGVDLPPAAVAAIPLAVGWKEGQRRKAEAEAQAEHSWAQRAIARGDL